MNLSYFSGMPLDSAPTSRQAIFERFERAEIDPFEAILALDHASAIGAARRKNDGVVYTPAWIAKDMCRLAAPTLDQAVWEPSCGRGVFVFALARFHLECGAGFQEVHDALTERLLVSELDPRAIEDLQALWSIFWRRHGVATPAPLRASVGDSLFGEAGSFDLALGNPPYVRFQNLPDDYRAKLQDAFETCAQGNVDLYYAFVERCLKSCSRSCLIVPNSWLGTRSGEALRQLLAPRCRRVVDFGSRLVFAPARAYCCVLLSDGAASTTADPLWVKFDAPSEAGPWVSIERADPRLGSKQWALSAAPASSEAAQAPRRLGDIATLRSGIATLADGAYAIKGARVEKGRAIFHDEELGRELAIPLGLAPKKAKLTKAKKAADLSGLTDRILFPYGPGGALLTEEELAAQAPDALAFLNARKERLALRDKGKQDGYEAWHAYGRRQGVKPLPSSALVAVAGMSQGKIQAFEFDAQAVGPLLFTSGFVLEPKAGSSCAEILAALESPQSWAWILAHGKPWAGAEGKDYRSYGAKLLLQLPLPA